MVPCLCWTVWPGPGLVLVCFVPCSAVPCPVVCGSAVCVRDILCFLGSPRNCRRWTCKEEKIDEADLGGRMPRYQGTNDCKRQQQQGVGNHPAAVQGQYGMRPA